MFKEFQSSIVSQINELKQENVELRAQVQIRKNSSPSKNINKTYKEMNGKRAQSTDKGYKKGSSSI